MEAVSFCTVMNMKVAAVNDILRVQLVLVKQASSRLGTSGSISVVDGRKVSQYLHLYSDHLSQGTWQDVRWWLVWVVWWWFDPHFGISTPYKSFSQSARVQAQASKSVLSWNKLYKARLGLCVVVKHESLLQIWFHYWFRYPREMNNSISKWNWIRFSNLDSIIAWLPATCQHENLTGFSICIITQQCPLHFSLSNKTMIFLWELALSYTLEERNIIKERGQVLMW